MIVSINPKPTMSEFVSLMKHTDELLNADALNRPTYYKSRNGSPLEDDVKVALDECSKGTPFENTIEKISGQKFPDIVVSKFYGVEVKSTKENHWTSTGSSILESSRIANIERIFMTFGKLGGNPIEFISRPYEECLYGIAVTHMPRYLIDMRLRQGETIFDKMNIKYDELRMMDNPVAPVSKYYRSHLKPGESLWWAGDAPNEVVPATIKLWSNLSIEEKRNYTIYGCVNFPEVFAGNYDRYALWLTSQGVVDSHIRDQFSAGGQELMFLSDGSTEKFPAVYRRIKDNLELFKKIMSQENTLSFIEQSTVTLQILNERLLEWSNSVSYYSRIEYNISMDALTTMFWGQNNKNHIE